MKDVLIIIGGLFWLLTYLEIIRKGFNDKTYGMPIAALLFNISWEFINSFIYPATGIQLYVNYLWLTLDFIMLYQLLKYWKNEFPFITPSLFYLFIALSIPITYSIIIVFSKEFGFTMGTFYSAFGANLMISILYISLFFSRRSLRGQSIFIALFKMLGTLVQVGAYYDYTLEIRSSLLLKFLYLSIFLFDLIYLILVYLQAKNNFLFPKENPKVVQI